MYQHAEKITICFTALATAAAYAIVEIILPLLDIQVCV